MLKQTVTVCAALVLCLPALADEPVAERRAIDCSALAGVYGFLPGLSDRMAGQAQFFGGVYAMLRKQRLDATPTNGDISARRELAFSDLRDTWRKARPVVFVLSASCDQWYEDIATAIKTGRINTDSDAAFLRGLPSPPYSPPLEQVQGLTEVTKGAFEAWANSGWMTPGSVRHQIEQSLR
jgi:hypothetical protein